VGGALDRVLTLLMDSLYSFPGLILAIAIAAVLGPGIGNIIVAIAVLYIPTYFRIVRGQTLSVKEQLYVEAAHSLGASRYSILRRYVFPNVIPSVVIIFSVNVADAILTEAGLSFLGLGLPPDTPDWGIDLARGQDYLRRAWWLITFPGLMVSLVTLAFSMLGESLSEILNPRLAEL
jgi:peptide/nickel transport system permease protein